MRVAELKVLAKECLSIVSTSRIKDKEIELWVKMAIEDMKRLGIDVENDTREDLIKGAIMMYVRANFGNTDVREKEICQSSYNIHVAELQVSSEV